MSAAVATKKLGEMLSIQNGYAFDSKLFSFAEGMPLIRIRDLQNGIKTVTKYTGAFNNKYIVKSGDLLIGMDGEFRCYEWHGGPALLNQRVCRLENFGSELHPRYLFYGLNRHLKEIEGSTGFATVKHISSRQILNIEFPVPSLTEQQRIVNILDEAFVAIANARACYEKNQSYASSVLDAYLQEILTNGNWPQKSVSNLAQHSLGKMLDKAKNKGSLQPYLRNLNVRWFGFDLADLLKMKFLPEEESKYTAIKGDVLICEGGYPGRGAIWDRDQPIYIQKAIHRVRFHDPIHAKWFLYFIYYQDGTGQLANHLTGTGIRHFTGQALGKYLIPLPSSSQLISIIKTCDALREESKRLGSLYKLKLVALDNLKQALLSKAFSQEL